MVGPFGRNINFDLIHMVRFRNNLGIKIVKRLLAILVELMKSLHFREQVPEKPYKVGVSLLHSLLPN